MFYILTLPGWRTGQQRERSTKFAYLRGTVGNLIAMRPSLLPTCAGTGFARILPGLAKAQGVQLYLQNTAQFVRRLQLWFVAGDDSVSAWLSSCWASCF